MKRLIKNTSLVILSMMFLASIAEGASQTIWGSTHRSISATNRIPVDTSSSSGPGYNLTTDIVDTMSGDCTSTAAAVTCTKTNGTAFTALATTVPGTGVATALGVNVGSAGAFVTFNGAGGTPSSLTGTNITGTASGLSIGGNAATATTATSATSATTAGTLTGALSANQLLGSLTAVAPTGQSVPSCSTSASALQWTSGTGFACNTAVAAPAAGLTGSSLASGVTGSSLTGLGVVATGTWQGTAINATYLDSNVIIGTIGATFTGNGSAITSGAKTFVSVPWAGTITGSTVTCDQSGSIQLGVQTSSYSGFPGSLTSIVASAPPTVTSAQKAQDTTLTGWTTSVSAGTVFQFSVTSATTVQNCTIVLALNRT